MELQQVLETLSAGISAVDGAEHDVRFNQRTGEAYLPGVKSMSEGALVAALDSWWATSRPDEFSPIDAHATGVPYPSVARTKCDFVFSTDGVAVPREWAVEVKNIVLVGNNGKANDFGVTKVLSPFLKDRSLLHDVLRLRANPLARRHAAIGYAFSYDLASCDVAGSLHPDHLDEVRNMRDVCTKNGGTLSVDSLVDFADGIMRVRGLVTGPMVQVPFEAWRHPCGGKGVLFGWEVRRPAEDGSFDARHPW